MQGFLTVTLAYLYRKEGMSVEQISVLVGLQLLPNIFKFIWGPLVDLTLSVKKWYFIANSVASVGLLCMGLLHASAANMLLIEIIIFISFFASTFVGLTVSSFMAYDTSPETKGRAGGFYNMGGLGGIGLGGSAGLVLAQYLPALWMVGAGLGVACMLCCFFIPMVKEPSPAARVKTAGQSLIDLLKDIWVTIKEKAAILALFLSFLPLGTGAAGSLFAAMAKDWHAGVNTVAAITGLIGAAVTMAGCFLGGYLCDIMNRQLAYVLFGIIQAVCALGMALCPHTDLFYAIWALAYSLANGLAYAGFTAFVLEVIGKGAAATKYNLYAGLANIPIFAITIVDGWANTRFGPAGMLEIEALSAGIGIVIFFLVKMMIGTKSSSATVAKN
jgi:MFS family permease